MPVNAETVKIGFAANTFIPGANSFGGCDGSPAIDDA
jgi:hypothetical protein